jgi:hypothetical protein
MVHVYLYSLDLKAVALKSKTSYILLILKKPPPFCERALQVVFYSPSDAEEIKTLCKAVKRYSRGG